VSGGTFLAYAPFAKVTSFSQTLVVTRANGKEENVGQETVLDEGDAVEIPPGVYVKIVDGAGFVFETPKNGLPAAPDQGRWIFMATGPKAVGLQ
jgi:hypothetical protein